MARLTVRLTPRGGKDAVEGWMRDAEGRAVLKARVSAPPADGAANAALIALLAKALSCPKSAIRLTSGAQSRVKRIEIDGLSEADVAAVLSHP
ncbi:MAG: DUF167 family protein [Caulobacterales bacterium]